MRKQENIPIKRVKHGCVHTHLDEYNSIDRGTLRAIRKKKRTARKG